MMRMEGRCVMHYTNVCMTDSAVRILKISNRIESNSYFNIRFDWKRAQLFEIFEYLPSPISYLFNRMTPIFHLSNHA